ncbi:MAG: DinB family protein [Chloroflexota bacterium]|nr:DinB family protein [Chloroflexota bacterium]
MAFLDKPRAMRSLRKTPTYLGLILNGVDQARAVGATDGADGWSVVETLCHLLDFERIFAERIHAMVDQEQPRFAVVDHLELVTRNGYKTRELATVWDEYLSARRALVAYLETLPAEAWSRTGVTGDGTTITVTEQAINLALHDLNHGEQMSHTLGLTNEIDY